MSFVPELWCTALLAAVLPSAQALRWAVERARHRAHVDTAAAALRNTPLARGMDIVGMLCVVAEGGIWYCCVCGDVAWGY